MELSGVRTVKWPAGEPARVASRRKGQPCLLLVAPDSEPPVVTELEDWVRLPASEADIRARLDALIRRATSSGHAVSLEDGVLRVGTQWVTLPPVQARLTAAFLAKPGAVVSRAALRKAAWPGEEPDRNTLDVHIGRLRRSLDRVGLRIVTVRSRGYMLDASGAGAGGSGRRQEPVPGV